MAVINWEILYIPDPVKGRPLWNGQIFVGEPDLDPETSPKQLNIVQETGAVVPVSQPFVLSAGGVPVYNGSPVRLDVDGNYSIRIRDKNGAQTYYVSNVLEGQPVTEGEMNAAFDSQLSGNVAAQFADVESAVLGEPISYPSLASPFDYSDYEGKTIETVYNNQASKAGGAKYIVKTKAQAAADGDVVNGYVNHDVSDGIHCAIQKIGDKLDVLSCGISTANTPTQNTAAIDDARLVAGNKGVPVALSSGTFTFDGSSLYDVYDIDGGGSLVWNGNTYSLDSQHTRQSSYDELGQRCRSGDRVVVGFFGDSTVRGIGTTGGANPPLTGTAPNIAPVTPVGDLNAYSPDGMPQRFEAFAQILFENLNIVACNGAYGGAAASNAFPVQYLDDIFLNNTTADFRAVEYMFINFAYNDATFFTDTVDDYKLYMLRLAKKCRGFGIEPVFMTADPAVNTGAAELLEVKGQLKNALYDVASELGVDVLPVGDELIKFYGRSELASWYNDQPDGVHVNSRGHRAKVQVLLKYVAGKEIFFANGSQDLNVSPLDDRCRGLSKYIGQDSVTGQSNLFFGTNHRILTSNFAANESAVEAWIWCDDPQALLYHMMATNEYDTTTTQVELPKFIVDNVAVNFDAPTQKTIFTADSGRPTFGNRIEEKPCLVTRLRYGLNRVELFTPNPARITYTHWQMGFLRVSGASSVGSLIEGKAYDNWGVSGRSTARMYRNLRPSMIIPTVTPVTQAACFADGEINGFDTDMIFTPDTVVDFKAKLYQDTGITFGAGRTNPVAPQGYCVRLTATDIILSHIAVNQSTGVPTITDLQTTAIMIANYDNAENLYRLRIGYPSTPGIGCQIQFYRYTAGVPTLVFAWNSESTGSKQCIPAVGLLFGGFWDAAAGSAGETLEILGGTVYSSVT